MNKPTEFNFLFLIDFTESSYKALNYLVKLAKRVNGSIELFYINDTTDLGEETNPITFLQSIEVDNLKAKRKLNALVEMIEVENIPIQSTYCCGSIKNELLLKLEKTNQTIVVSKSNQSIFNEVSSILINQIKHSVLIINEHQKFENGNSIVIGSDEKSLTNYCTSLTLSFANASQKPLIILHPNYIDNQLPSFNSNNSVDVFYKAITHNKLVEGFKDFVSNNKVELLCLCRGESNQSFFKKLFTPYNIISDVVNNINSSILIMKKL